MCSLLHVQQTTIPPPYSAILYYFLPLSQFFMISDSPFWAIIYYLGHLRVSNRDIVKLFWLNLKGDVTKLDLDILIIHQLKVLMSCPAMNAAVPARSSCTLETIRIPCAMQICK
ncbi:hypothetical protein GDO78_012021 [Eleutherodactylus coqui]|uniref:Uncharacterized protein n=1 Tax=Eleutherodactylus coqui TaxID=57060 RepID=A0A8J6K594_ELECQ|nr:hypothetical protein GDO78_012021 [Eleutherodactylus coqui]